MARTAGPRIRRHPAGGGPLTRALAGRIAAGRRPVAVAAIKGIHTAIFISVGTCIGIFLWDAVRQRAGRRATIALGIALAEAAVYASNNQVCPLTPLAEDLGAKRASVADIYLPDWFSSRVPLFGSSALLVGIFLRLRTWRARRPTS